MLYVTGQCTNPREQNQNVARRGQRIFPLASVQTGSGDHPASCTMGTGGKAWPGRDADHSPLSSAEVMNE
jgi:hypothetical protein